jgi:hypothetical protein
MFYHGKREKAKKAQSELSDAFKKVTLISAKDKKYMLSKTKCPITLSIHSIMWEI